MDFAVRKGGGNAELFGGEDGGFHFITGFDAEFIPEFALETGEDEVREEEKTPALLENLVDFEAGPVLSFGEGFVALGVDFNAHMVGVLLADKAGDFLSAFT